MPSDPNNPHPQDELWRQLQHDSDASFASAAVDKISAAIAKGETPAAEEAASIRKEIRELLNWHPTGTAIALNKMLPPDQQIDANQAGFREQVGKALDSLLGTEEPHLKIVDVPGTMVDTATRGYSGGDSQKREFENAKFQARVPLVTKVLSEMGVNVAGLPLAKRESKVPDNAMRNSPYILIRIPELDKTIMVCEETENKTFVIYTADEEKVMSEFFGKSKTYLDKHPQVRYVHWSHNEESIKRRLRAFLESESPPPRREPTVSKFDSADLKVHPEDGSKSGVVALTNPETGQGREAIGISAYSRHIGLSDHALTQLIKEAKLQTTGVYARFKLREKIDGSALPTVSMPVETYWKEEVDHLLPIELDNDGFGLVDGERVVALRNFVSLNPETASYEIMPQLVELAGIKPLDKLGQKTGKGSHKRVVLYRESELSKALERADELRGIRRPDSKGYLTVPVEGEAEDVKAMNVAQLANMLLEAGQIENKKLLQAECVLS